MMCNLLISVGDVPGVGFAILGVKAFLKKHNKPVAVILLYRRVTTKSCDQSAIAQTAILTTGHCPEQPFINFRGIRGHSVEIKPALIRYTEPFFLKTRTINGRGGVLIWSEIGCGFSIKGWCGAVEDVYTRCLKKMASGMGKRLGDFSKRLEDSLNIWRKKKTAVGG